MTHEFKKIVQSFLKAQQIGLKSVVATVVALDGSSYRQPGVRMLITENGQMTGAVSGGCVEKEILKQAHSVFKSNLPKIMTYDGRYRLGCEGILYILIEPFDPSTSFLAAFKNCLETREDFSVTNYFVKEIGSGGNMGSIIHFSSTLRFPFNQNSISEFLPNDDVSRLSFTQILKPAFKLIIIGGEHDAVQLCAYAAFLGWDVEVILSPSNPQKINDFPGAKKVIHQNAEVLEINNFNQKETAIVLMTHSYVSDLKYLLQLKDVKVSYLGLLGPSKRREKLLGELVEQTLVEDGFFDCIYGPAGLNLGAETPQEIALSICSEILAVFRGQDTSSLKNKKGNIHTKFLDE